MSADTAARSRRSLVPLVAVTVAALVFVIVLVLVRIQWAPLESADHGATAHLNHLIAGHATIVSIVKAVTYLGSNAVLWTVIAAAAITLALRKRWWLAVYLVVTGAGALALDPVLKSLVGRLRPVVAHPIAYGTGDSFPSGHSLGSIVCYVLPDTEDADEDVIDGSDVKAPPGVSRAGLSSSGCRRHRRGVVVVIRRGAR
jgi:membrane-associated phospholipid phosphatase